MELSRELFSVVCASAFKGENITVRIPRSQLIDSTPLADKTVKGELVGRGAKKELKSATATTAEMTGKITLRVNNQGVATLHSIKVLQPKQVRVDSNHERTRELVWRRSARIAHVVSEKLMTVSKPMFFHQSVTKE
ncbi:hypothetical protein MSG28_004159 [Choristoneura fumiferana]|uniref:Uncharacterized protein n=1 Tax=Choristoneura fumiferana TaxID=7141 RepID=A0ACC0KHU0_CHOFU|nr:hypothetical protein MSG28_004159 [Choristoneura fumiferana]